MPATSEHLRLTTELSFGSDLARHARNFRRERVELIHHSIDRVLEFENFALHIDGDLLREVAVGNRRRDVRDVAHLRGQISGHRVDVVGQVLPDAGYA